MSSPVMITLVIGVALAGCAFMVWLGKRDVNFWEAEIDPECPVHAWWLKECPSYSARIVATRYHEWLDDECARVWHTIYECPACGATWS